MPYAPAFFPWFSAVPRAAAVVVAAALAASTAAADDVPAAAVPGSTDFGVLAPLDLSSPRATLESFRDTVDTIAASIRRDGIAAQRRPENMRLVGRALSCLDLSKIAPSLARTEGAQAAVCLKEVLDRIPLPPDVAIPDSDAVRSGGLKRWRLPGTEIVLTRVADGNREGDFVFDDDTVARAESFFQSIRAAPYRPDAGSPGLRALYVEAGGWMIPESLIHALPSWAHRVVFDETVWQWAATALLVVAAGIFLLKAWHATRRDTAAGPRGPVGGLTFPALVIALCLGVDYLLTYQIRLTGDNLLVARVSLRVITLGAVVTGVLVAMNWLSGLLIRARGMRPEGIDSQLIRLGGKVLTFLVVAWIVIQAADSLGIPVTPLVAGLGAGGLAVALASQYTVENLIAGLVIFADKPVRIGDECRFGDVRGHVEQIGLRSTRVRAEDRSLITVPNAEFAKLQLVNYTRRDKIPLRIPLTLPAGMTPRRLKDLLARLRQCVLDDPRLAADGAAARLTGQGSAGPSVEVSAVALTADEREFAAIREDLLLAIMEEIQAADAAREMRRAA